MCNLASLYDNNNEFRRNDINNNGILVRISHNVSDWFQRIQYYLPLQCKTARVFCGKKMKVTI